MSGNMFDEVEYVNEDGSEAAEEEVFDPTSEVLEEMDEEVQQDSRVSEAMKKLEKAQLYQTLITQSVFGPGSARPEILAEVDAELREFADRRLNVLLGMEADDVPRGKVQFELPFTEEETSQLKQLAGRMVERLKEQTPPTPNVVKVQAPATPKATVSPTLRKAAPAPKPKPAPAPKKVQPPAARQQKRVAPSPVAAPTAPTKPPSKVRRIKTENVGEYSGTNYAQAGNPKALPMPSPAAMMRIEASRQADAEQSMGQSDLGNLLMVAVKASQNKNKNVVEDAE